MLSLGECSLAYEFGARGCGQRSVLRNAEGRCCPGLSHLLAGPLSHCPIHCEGRWMFTALTVISLVGFIGFGFTCFVAQGSGSHTFRPAASSG